MTGFWVLKIVLHAREQLGRAPGTRAAVIEHLPRHGVEDALGHRRRSRNLQEMAAGRRGSFGIGRSPIFLSPRSDCLTRRA